ncbi:hypothetical protein JTB14_025080 [Gonioctena quinquepunctata]|nr:hypothetical protein JTB14_025080 [Gonioctena quinquepunctata]
MISGQPEFPNDLIVSCTFSQFIERSFGGLIASFLIDSCFDLRVKCGEYIPFPWLLSDSLTILAPLFIPNEETSLSKKYGPWALITGSTDGIGRAYAYELASRGINIVLVSRNQKRLENTAREIADFSLGQKAVDTVKESVGFLPINILVNNVGKQYEYPMYLTEVPEKELSDIIAINVSAVTLMCRAFIDDMKKRGRGAIVNVSSGSELQPLPLMTVYAATKAYIRSFTAALRYEYGGDGITIQHLAPMFVNTKMNAFSNKLQENKFYVPDAEQYAKYAVMTLGKTDETSGYWAHGIQVEQNSVLFTPALDNLSVTEL